MKISDISVDIYPISVMFDTISTRPIYRRYISFGPIIVEILYISKYRYIRRNRYFHPWLYLNLMPRLLLMSFNLQSLMIQNSVLLLKIVVSFANSAFDSLFVFFVGCPSFFFFFCTSSCLPVSILVIMKFLFILKIIILKMAKIQRKKIFKKINHILKNDFLLLYLLFYLLP